MHVTMRTMGVGFVACALAVGVGACTQSGGSGPSSSTSVSAPPTAEPKGDGTLVLSALLARTGDDTAASPAQNAAIHAAVAQINAAGGVNGTPVTLVESDTMAPTTSTDLTAAKVDVAIGTPTEALATALPVPSVWPAPATPAALAVATPDKAVILTASEKLQAMGVAEALKKDARDSIGIIARDDDAGKQAATDLTEALAAAKLTTATEPVFYDPAGSFTVAVTKVKGASPGAIVVVGGDEAARAIPELSLQGIGPANVPVYLSGPTTAAVTGLPEGSLPAVTLLRPGAEVTAEFQQQLLAVAPDLTRFDSASEAYDGAILAALAAVAADDDDGAVVMANVPAVSSDGAECTSFAQCVDLLKAKKDIAYVGKSGPSQVGDEGWRRAGQVGLITFDDKNAVASTTFVTVKP